MSKSPTQRTLAELRKLGATCQVVERWNPFAKVRQDLLGFIDVLALIGPNTLGIQATTPTNHAARVGKILAEPRAKAWLRAGNLIEVWSWNGKICRKEAITLEDFQEVASA